MNKKFKMYARILAVATTVGMTHAATTTISGINSDGILANSTGHLCTVNNVAAAAATMVPGVIPEGAALVIHGGALTFTSGGFVQRGANATIDYDTTANTILSWYAEQSGNLYCRSSVKGTTIAAFTISTLAFDPAVKQFKVWKDADTTALTITTLMRIATTVKDADTVPATDIPTTVPTATIGGRSYTLVKWFQS